MCPWLCCVSSLPIGPCRISHEHKGNFARICTDCQGAENEQLWASALRWWETAARLIRQITADYKAPGTDELEIITERWVQNNGMDGWCRVIEVEGSTIDQGMDLFPWHELVLEAFGLTVFFSSENTKQIDHRSLPRPVDARCDMTEVSGWKWNPSDWLLFLLLFNGQSKNQANVWNP